MVERKTIAQIHGWLLRNFTERGYNFVIEPEDFGGEMFPVVRITPNTRWYDDFIFTFILDNYEPKYPDSSDIDFGDHVTVDLESIDYYFHDEMKRYWEWFYNNKKKDKDAVLWETAMNIYDANRERFDW